MKEYIEGWEKIYNRRKKLLEEKRQEAESIALKMASLLVSEFNVRKVYLIGSLLRPSKFHNASDIDLAVEELPSSDYFKALGKLLLLSDFSVDLIPIEQANSEMLDEIFKNGKVLYDYDRPNNFIEIKGRNCIYHFSL